LSHVAKNQYEKKCSFTLAHSLDYKRHSIILLMTTISCCTCSAPSRWVTSPVNVN